MAKEEPFTMGFTNKAEDTGGDPLPEALIKEVKNRSRDNELPCAVAFAIAEDLHVPAADVGKAADRLSIRLAKCQLGLFGYKPRKKIVEAQDSVEADLKDAIYAALENDRLPCRKAWDIARRFGLRKMAVSSACETLGVKIKPCQLGAF
jgi:hypothetical protein